MPNPFRETKFSGTNTDREIFIFSVQLTTCRTGNLTRLIHTLAICVAIHTCMYRYVCSIYVLLVYIASRCGTGCRACFAVDSYYVKDSRNYTILNSSLIYFFFFPDACSQ